MNLYKKSGMTLTEVMIAVFFLAVAVLGYLTLNQMSNKGTMDAYYECLAFSLAREPIEIFRGIGYDAILNNRPTWYPADGTAHDIPMDLSDLQYPAESELFQRTIYIEEIGTEKGKRGVKVTVTVSAKGQSKAEMWMNGTSVTLSSIIMEQIK